MSSPMKTSVNWPGTLMEALLILGPLPCVLQHLALLLLMSILISPVAFQIIGRERIWQRYSMIF
jgi:hypothetical protein